jgi:hypothetical protein
VWFCEMTDALTSYYFKDIVVIKAEHPACKMWQADALLMAELYSICSVDAGEGLLHCLRKSMVSS